MTRLFLTLILISSITFSIAQQSELSHKVFTEGEGLLFDQIKALEFDEDGFLWLGGENFNNRRILGNDKNNILQRFNGSTFHSIELPNSSAVSQIYKRSDGMFYVASDVLLLFDPKSLDFQETIIQRRDLRYSYSNVISYENEDYVLSQKNRQLTIHRIREDLSVESVFSFTTNENKFLIDEHTQIIPFQNYWVFSDDNFPVSFVDWQGNMIKQLRKEDFAIDRAAMKDKLIIDGFYIRNDSTLCLLRGEIQEHFLDLKRKELIALQGKAHQFPNDALESKIDSTNQFMLITANAKALHFNHYPSDFNSNQSYSTFPLNEPSGISVVSQNFDKDIWIGTRNGELHHFQFPSQKIERFMEESQIRAITELDSSNYLVATDDSGWHLLDLKNKHTRQIPLTFEGKRITPNYSRKFFIEGDTIWSHSAGTILAVNKNSWAANAYRHYPEQMLVKPTDSTIVFSTNSYSLTEFNQRTKEFRPLINTDSLFTYDIELVGNFLVAANDKGVFTYDFDSLETHFYQDETGLEDPFFLSVEYHTDHGILLGTRNGELLSFNPENASFTTVYKDNLNAGIATVLFQEETLWINTFNGIVAFNTETKESVRFSEKDGLSNNEANRYSAFDTGDGFLVGCIRGLNYFKPEELKPDKNFSELVVLKVRNYDPKSKKIIDILNRSQLNNKHTITLPAEAKELEIDFSITHNAENRPHTYQYKINDENWVNIAQENSIRFPSLGAGKYDLLIKAEDFSGNLIGKPLQLQINSKNFFYKTWWFFASLFTMLILLSVYFLSQAKEKSKMQEKFSEDLLFSQEEERTRIAKDLHDSIGQQLTLIKKKAQNVSQDEISTLTNTALEEIRSISRNLYPTILKQVGLSSSIEQLIYDIDEETALFITEEIHDIDDLFSEKDSLNLYRFIQECFSNILKHAEATAVNFSLLKQSSLVILAIEDNGKGFDVSLGEKEKSLGLKTLSERIRILGGTFEIKSEFSKGTKILVQIPKK